MSDEAGTGIDVIMELEAFIRCDARYLSQIVKAVTHTLDNVLIREDDNDVSVRFSSRLITTVERAAALEGGKDEEGTG